MFKPLCLKAHCHDYQETLKRLFKQIITMIHVLYTNKCSNKK